MEFEDYDYDDDCGNYADPEDYLDGDDREEYEYQRANFEYARDYIGIDEFDNDDYNYDDYDESEDDEDEEYSWRDEFSAEDFYDEDDDYVDYEADY